MRIVRKLYLLILNKIPLRNSYEGIINLLRVKILSSILIVQAFLDIEILRA